MLDYIYNHIRKAYDLKKAILENENLIHLIKEVAQKTIEVYQQGNKTLIAGNGGSAADAQHIAGEFVSKFYFNRPGLPAIALTTDTSILTAVANDYGFEELFARQIQANGAKGDLFLGISTSGNSINIIKAFEECKKKEIITVGLTGQDGSYLNQTCDYCIKVPSNETPRIQEAHIMIGHIICSVVEEALFGKGF